MRIVCHAYARVRVRNVLIIIIAESETMQAGCCVCWGLERGETAGLGEGFLAGVRYSIVLIVV